MMCLAFVVHTHTIELLECMCTQRMKKKSADII